MVVRTERLLHHEQRKALEEFVKRHTPPCNKVLVLDAGLRLEVLSPQAQLTESEIADLWLSSSVRHVRSGHASKAVVEDFARSIERRDPP